MNCDEFKTPNAQRPTPNVESSETEKFSSGFRKHLRFLFGGKFHRFDEAARLRFAQRERIIGAKCDAFRTEKFDQHPQGVGVVNK